jgi:hypothetical protein
MNQTEPLPFLPPLTVEEFQQAKMMIIPKLAEFRQFCWNFMFRWSSGFMEQPSEVRLAFYMAHEPLLDFFFQPNLIPSASGMAEVDPMTGQQQPAMLEAPSLHEINAVQVAVMLKDAATLYTKFGKKIAPYGTAPGVPLVEAPV